MSYVSPDSGFLEGAVHPFDLAVGPRMVRLGEPVLDAMLAADTVEHVQSVAGRWASASRRHVAELGEGVANSAWYR